MLLFFHSLFLFKNILIGVFLNCQSPYIFASYMLSDFQPFGSLKLNAYNNFLN